MISQPAGLITRDMENSYLAFDPGEEARINSLLGYSMTYRVATGPREGQKVFTLQTIPAEPEPGREDVAESSGLLRASCPSPFGPAFGCSKSSRRFCLTACRVVGKGH